MAIYEINNALVMDWAEINRKEDNTIISTITSHTVNTWQKNRKDKEKSSDTKLGKFAEDAVMRAFVYYNISNYHSYDSFRNDGFELHAPFDGMFCKDVDSHILEYINKKVKDEGCSLSAQSRNFLRENGVMTCEIKSTRLANKYKNQASFTNYNDEVAAKRLIDHLNKLDYLTYPHFTRYGNKSYEEYCNYANSKFQLNIKQEDLFAEIKNIELTFSADIYFRVFVDETCQKAIVLGWMNKDTLFSPPELKKMVLTGKSEMALYFVKRINRGYPLSTFEDYKNKNT